MAKFLRLIVNVVLLAAILVACALLVPTFMGRYGISTVISDSVDKDTNIPLGSVVYAKDINAALLKEGDIIVHNDAEGENVYKIVSAEIASGSYGLHDRYNPSAEDRTTTLRNNVQKVIVVVPFIGYTVMAMYSTEGMIIMGLAIVFLIILFILSELWKKPDEDEYEDEDGYEEERDDYEDDDFDDEERPAKSRKEIKREIKERKKREKREKRRAKASGRKGYRESEDFDGQESEAKPADNSYESVVGSSPEAIMASVAGEIAMQVEAAAGQVEEPALDDMETDNIPEISREELHSVFCKVDNLPSEATSVKEAQGDVIEEAELANGADANSSEEAPEEAASQGEAEKVSEKEDGQDINNIEEKACGEASLKEEEFKRTLQGEEEKGEGKEESLPAKEEEEEKSPSGKTPFRRTKIAMPRMEAEDILEKEKKHNLQPKLIKEEELGFSLVDYTEIFK